MSNYQNHIKTDNSIIIILDDDMLAIPSENPMHADVCQAIDGMRFADIPDLIDKVKQLRAASKGKFEVDQYGVIILDGERIPEQLSRRLLLLVDADEPTDALTNLWKNICLMDDEGSRKDMYLFLEFNESRGIPLTMDGHFLAYKGVRSDFKDCRTGRYDNSPGCTVVMDRAAVDPNPRNTCSHGLHVATFEYANNFGSGGNLVEVKVNPRDVVAVPDDYNNQKMRVCRYEVTRLIVNEHVEPLVCTPGDEMGHETLGLVLVKQTHEDDTATVIPIGDSDERGKEHRVKFAELQFMSLNRDDEATNPHRQSEVDPEDWGPEFAKMVERGEVDMSEYGVCHRSDTFAQNAEEAARAEADDEDEDAGGDQGGTAVATDVETQVETDEQKLTRLRGVINEAQEILGEEDVELEDEYEDEDEDEDDWEE